MFNLHSYAGNKPKLHFNTFVVNTILIYSYIFYFVLLSPLTTIASFCYSICKNDTSLLRHKKSIHRKKFPVYRHSGMSFAPYDVIREMTHRFLMESIFYAWLEMPDIRYSTDIRSGPKQSEGKQRNMGFSGFKKKQVKLL